jgi:bifunctional non-homologous end joining protein LigD
MWRAFVILSKEFKTEKMSLTKYNQKRNFDETAEPKGKIGKSDNELLFVVQKHAASHLHYDFRLEMDGVLKSWAVPKGPSLDPQIKRLAMMVEDHPYSYKDFEGNIPEGNYGAGNVIVWDNGTYLPADDYKGTAENKLKADLHKGHLSFILKGKKLNGLFSLVKLKNKQENAWLLLKKEDAYATTDDVLKKNKSVISKSTLEALEKKQGKKTEKKATKKQPSKPIDNTEATFIKPMLANTTEKPFDDEDWIFENKYDGYRTLAVINPGNVQLFSRNQLSFTNNFKPIAEQLEKIPHSAVLDGEVVVENASGRSDFQMLQNYIKTGKGKLVYYVFDILSLDGTDTTTLSLLERKELLQLLLKNQKLSNIIYSEHIVGKGIPFFELAEKNKNEGIMAKKANSTYAVGQRSNNWLKIKISEQEETIIVGITEPKQSRAYFGALLLAQYDGKDLKYVGKCGTGFKEDTLKDLYKKFEPYFIDKSPVTDKVPLRDTIQWIKPKYVAQIKFTEWTQDKHLRHPVFLGLRTDKTAKEVIFTSKSEIKMETAKPRVKRENEYDLKVGKTTLHLTNQNKVYFPDDGITKGDIIEYYNQIADIILPYLKDRPQSMNRFPNGINGPSFYQKDVDVDKVPSWLKTAAVYSESNDADIDYLICNHRATLLYMANLGCIEINPWNSTLKNSENPDWVVMDIDPDKKEDFPGVIRTALTVKDIMDELETDCYCKTSGATGLHVYIPLGGKYDYDIVKIFAELIAREVHARLPEITSLERSIKKRDHKIYIDFLQNRKGQTLAAPYSVRPKPGATVSTPLDWNEVNDSLLPSSFTINNMLERFNTKGDLWKPVLGKGADIPKILKKLEARKKG